MPTSFLPRDMLKALRLDDFNRTADEQQLAFNPTPPEPEPTPTGPAAPTAPTFSLPSWDDVALGASSAAQQVTGAVQQAAGMVQEAAGAFKLPEWDSFKLPGSSNQEQIEQPKGRAAGDALPEWTTIAFPDVEETVGPGLSSPGTQTAGAGVIPSPQAPAVGGGPQGEFVDYARGAAQRVGIDPEIFVRQIDVENGFKPTGGSPAGAQGIAQIVPKYHPGVDVNDPYASLDYAANLMKSHLETYSGDIRKALQAYNAGPGAVASGAADTFAETKDYLEKILGGVGAAPVQGVQSFPSGNRPESTLRSTQGQAASAQTPYDIAFDYDQPYGDAQFNPDIARHRGVDLVVRGAENNGRGSPVAAFQGGTVTALTQDPNGGNGVIIQDAAGLYHRYFHLDSIGVKQGQKLAPGETIGTLGASGTEDFPHVHFEVSKGLNGDQVGQTIDPRPYMAGAPAQQQPEQAGEVLMMSSGDVPEKGAGLRGMQAFEGNDGDTPGAAPVVVGDNGSDDLTAPTDNLVGGASALDSERGPFDPPGYGDEPEPEPERNIFERVGQGIGDASRNVTGALNQTAADIGNQFAPRTEPTSPSFETDEGPGPAAPLIEPVVKLPGRINEAAQPTSDESAARDAVLARTEASDLPEAAKIALRAMQSTDDMVNYLTKLLGSAVYLPIRDTVIKPILETIGAEHHIDVPVLGEMGTADIVAGAIPGLNALGGASRVGARGVPNIAPGETVIGRPIAAAAGAIADSPVGRDVRQAIGTVRDTATALTRGLPGGAPVAGVVDDAPPAPRGDVADPTLAAEADRFEAGRQGGARPAGPAAGIVESDRYYHGTGSAFDTPNPAQFDENGLFGPGYYLTSDPRVAGGVVSDTQRIVQPGYAMNPGGPGGYQLDGEMAVDFWRKKLDEATTPAAKAEAKNAIRLIRERIENQVSGANVRAVNVPRGLRLLDAEAPAPDDAFNALMDVMPTAKAARDLEMRWSDDLVGSDLQDVIMAALDSDLAAVNKVLAAAGFDGISYSGGKRIPMADEGGAPIEHDVTMIFGDSLPKITNATSGRPGGLLPSASPGVGRLASQAAGGAVAGGYSASQEEGADLGSVARGVALGAAGGVARGAIGRRGSGQVLARAVANNQNTNPPPPLGTLYNQPGATPQPANVASRLEMARRGFVRAWTDRQVDASIVQKEAAGRIAKAQNRPLDADEMFTELSRLNPNDAAKIRVQDGLRPAIQTVGDDRLLLSELLTYRDNVDVAAAMGNPNRKFSFGLTAQESAQRIQQLEQQVGPARWQKLDDASRRVQDFVESYRKRMVSSGVWTQDTYNLFAQRYPNYTPTRILDYMQDPAHVPVGKSLNVRERGIHANSFDGTERAREDPLASLVRYAYDAEAIIRKNEAFNGLLNLRDADPEFQKLIRQVPVSYSKKNIEALVTGFVNGERQQFVMPEALAPVVTAEPGASIPGLAGTIVQGVMNLFRMGTTSRNPTFLVANSTLDAAGYAVRESTRAGGPQHLPRLMAELASSYGNAFEGLLSGTYKGDAARFLREGGGQFGFFNRNEKGAQESVRDLARSNVFEIKGAADIKRLLGGLLTLKPVETIGERIELAPRVAAMRNAERRGANQTQSIIAGRTVTMDFAQGGNIAKVVNQFVPFFNVGIQGAATMPRAFRENPAAFVASGAALLTGPTLAAEAWNRSDEQRAKDYDDVPGYLKDSGIVVMLPGDVSKDAQGNRRPQFLHIRTREYTPFVTIARQAAAKAWGDDTRPWADMLAGTFSTVSPVQGNSPTDVVTGFTPVGISTALQLGFNRDAFRDRNIATASGDERASALAKGVSGAINVAGSTGLPFTEGLRDVRPSQVEFAARDLGGGVAGMVLAGSDLVTGKGAPDGRPQSIPGAGGMIGRFQKDAIGDRLERTEGTAGITDQKVLDTMRQAGVNIISPPFEIPHPTRTGASIQLTRADQEQYQAAVRDHLQASVKPGTTAERIEQIQRFAREKAKLAVLKAIPLDDPRRKVLQPAGVR